jgi:hypothetical protein
MTGCTGYELIGLLLDMVRLVLHMHWCSHFMCPFLVARLGFRYFVTPFAVRLGHPVEVSASDCFQQC